MWIRVTESGTKHPRLINMNDCTDVDGCTGITRISHALGEYIQVSETVDQIWEQVKSFQAAEVQMQQQVATPNKPVLTKQDAVAAGYIPLPTCELCPPTCGECGESENHHTSTCSRGPRFLVVVAPGRNRCPVHREANL